MSGSQRSLSLSVVPLFTGATQAPTLTTPSILSPALNHLDNSVEFDNIKETTDENITAHCSALILKCTGDEVGPYS